MSAGQFAEARAAYQRAVKFALTMSERQALVASVNMVELDIACGNTAAALQLGRPLALSLQHLGRRETLFELLSHMFSALLISGEIQEARATGKELYDLALAIGCQQALHGSRCDGIARVRGTELRGGGADCRLLRWCS